MKTTFLAVALAALTLAPVWAADRLTDRDVKAVIDRIDEDRDQFENALSGDFKDSVIKSQTGEVKVDAFLDDFDTNIDRLKDRLTSDYSASAEAAVVLRQATIIDGYFRRQPPGTRGESEWNRMSADLKTLSSAYGADFPLAEGASVVRLGDRALASAVDDVAKAAEKMKESLDTELKKDTTINEQSRKTMVDSADALAKDAKALKERVDDSNPSSAEADRLLSDATKMQAVLDTHQVPESRSTWTGIVPKLQSISRTYRLPWAGQ